MPGVETHGEGDLDRLALSAFLGVVSRIGMPDPVRDVGLIAAAALQIDARQLGADN